MGLEEENALADAFHGRRRGVVVVVPPQRRTVAEHNARAVRYMIVTDDNDKNKK